MDKLRSWWVIAIALLALVPAAVAVTASPASGQPLRCQQRVTVSDHGDDGGRRQLRAALDRVCDGGLVQVRPGTVTLHHGTLTIEQKTVSVATLGRPNALLTIDGAGTDEVLFIDGGSLALHNVVVTGGSTGVFAFLADLTLGGVSSVTGNAGTGVRLHQSGEMVLNDAASVVANGGSGIDTFFVPVSLNDSARVSENAGHGLTGSFGDVTLNGASVVSGNGGGGVSVGRSTVTLNDAARVQGNAGRGIATNRTIVTLNGSSQVVGSGGGGIALSDGHVVLNDAATVSGNTTSQEGGGVRLFGSRLTLTGNATITGNTATLGGGVYLLAELPGPSIVTLNDSSAIRENMAANGGGIFNVGGAIVINDDGTVEGNVPNDIAGP